MVLWWGELKPTKLPSLLAKFTRKKDLIQFRSKLIEETGRIRPEVKGTSCCCKGLGSVSQDPHSGT